MRNAAKRLETTTLKLLTQCGSQAVIWIEWIVIAAVITTNRGWTLITLRDLNYRCNAHHVNLRSWRTLNKAENICLQINWTF